MHKVQKNQGLKNCKMKSEIIFKIGILRKNFKKKDFLNLVKKIKFLNERKFSCVQKQILFYIILDEK